MRWLMEFKMMNNIRIPSSLVRENHDSSQKETVFCQQGTAPVESQGLRLDQDILDTINEIPENVEDTGSLTNKIDSQDTASSSIHETNSLKTVPDVSSPRQCEMSFECNDVSNSKSSPAINSSCLSKSLSSPPSTSNSKTDQEDALSADEGIQTSPPFERDDPWDHEELDGETPRRRYSMSTALLTRPGRREDREGEESVTLRSPSKTWLGEELKARRSRYRKYICIFV